MTRILYDSTTATLVRYPRDDDGPVIGLDAHYLDLALIQEPEPSYDPQTQRLEPTQTIDTDALTCTRGWSIVALPPPPPASDWIAFSTALMTDPGINAMLGSVLAAAPAIYGGLTVGLSEVSKGSPQLFLNAWSSAKTVVTIDPAVVASLQAMAAAHDLPVEFREGLV